MDPVCIKILDWRVYYRASGDVLPGEAIVDGACCGGSCVYSVPVGMEADTKIYRVGWEAVNKAYNSEERNCAMNMQVPFFYSI